ncbi:MAG TPA: alpha-amylase family glycosyl hydrolase [Pyrinomonadaceae bacterium]|jgi:glycosidase|nr:alpha-amylase family glycosyl hydrolase [Pyrinomonadaceae bacterium]
MNIKHRRFTRMALILALVFAALLPQQALARQADASKASARAGTPEWVRGGVIYEIYPRDFSEKGNFEGVTAELDRLKNLGVNILWLMPIHPIGQEKKKGPIGSPYAVRDYFAINPDYGTAADLKRLVSEAHKRGMKVIIDVVANHTSWDSVMMKTPEFYVRDASGKITFPHDWSDVAELNYDNPQLRRYMIDMLKFWLRDFDLDGFRCDVAAEVPTDFWEQARAELDKVKHDIVMLAESDKPELLASAFDLDYSWPLHGTLNDVMRGRKPATAFRETWESDAAKYPRGALRMRFSDNHDEKRAVARFGEPGALAASALMFTLDGVPMLYNGMEVGDTTESGDPALFYHLPVFWPIVKRRPEFPRFYQQFIALRKDHSALTRGTVEWLRNSDDARVVTFARRDDREEIVVAINFSNTPLNVTVEAPAGAAFTDITPDTREPVRPDASPSERAERARTFTLPSLSLDAWGYRVFRRAR